MNGYKQNSELTDEKKSSRFYDATFIYLSKIWIESKDLKEEM